MNKMKWLIAMMLVLTMALSLVACAQPQNSTGSTPNKQPSTPGSSSSSSQTQPSSTQKEEPGYVVTVVDQDGNPVAGAMVLLCDDNKCYVPVTTNENGVAEFTQKNVTGAKSKVASVPAGYTIDAPAEADAEGYVHYTEGSNTMTLTVTKTAE